MEQEQLFTTEDLALLEARGISAEEATRQVHAMRTGFPYLQILASASLERGIVRIDASEQAGYMQAWTDYLSSPSASVCKMVPASGAASRMFKSLFSYIDADEVEPSGSVKRFFDEIQSFAFYDRLGEICLRNNWKSTAKLITQGEYKEVLRNLLQERGLNYGALPKGLIPFHSYSKGSCTAAEEHLVEGALYAREQMGQVRIHFTVSPEHLTAFRNLIDERREYFEDKYGVYYDVTYSEQQASTDTLALSPSTGLPFRTDTGGLVFRPGGHGSLINNLGDLEADVIFIKNIDNVVPDHLKGATVMYKKLLAGVLINLRKRIYTYVEQLEGGRLSRTALDEIAHFVTDTLCIDIPEATKHDDEGLQRWLLAKLDRPCRVCGMVRNQGEPGGGPFLIREADGSTSLQILESVQIDMNDPVQRAYFEAGGYFNPVDLVCSIRDHKGQKYDLHKYVNPQTAFLSHKSLEGRELIALERPGLWNGAMHHWNTIFVEVPIETFNPVKEVNDLLRYEHQGKNK